MKTRPWKFVDLARTCMITALFERMITRQKTVFLGPPKSSKNMFSKLILIGLFVLNNKRTIREPKKSSGRVVCVSIFDWLVSYALSDWIILVKVIRQLSRNAKNNFVQVFQVHLNIIKPQIYFELEKRCEKWG